MTSTLKSKLSILLSAILGLAIVSLIPVFTSSARTNLTAPEDTDVAGSRLRVVHLAPFAMDPNTAVTITLNGSTALTNFAYGDSTEYFGIDADTYLVEVFPGASATPAITASLTLENGKDYTAIAIGDGVNQPLSLKALVDDNTPPAAGKAHLRLGHLAPFAADPNTVADVRLDDGTVILDDVSFGDVAGYIPLDAGTYDLKITTPDGATTLINLVPVTLNDGDIVSAFAVGDGSNQDLQGFALPSGAIGFFIPVEPRLQVAHLAPFAMDPNTVVTITLNGTPALTDFAYGDSTPYIDLDPDTYLVEVFPGSSATPAITATVDLMSGMDYTAIAIGDGVNQPLSLKALVDDNTPPAAGKAHLRLGHLAPFAADPDTVADVRLDDGTVILDDVSFSDVAGYIPLDAGTYDLKITTPDGAITLIDLVPVTLNDGDIVSAFAVGDGSNQDLQGFALPSGAQGFFIDVEPGPRLQVAHLAPFAMDPNTAVTITLNGTPALTDFAYGDSTPYIDLTPGSYLVEVFPGASATPAITASLSLEGGEDYTAIAIGDGVNQPLSLKALVDDNTPPAAGKAHLRLGHLAPFAADPNTVADVRLDDGTVILDDVSFGDVAGYMPLDAGTYDLKITTPDGATTLINLVPVTLNDGDIVSAFAVGDGSNQDLQGFALPSGAQGFFIPTEEYQIFMPIIFGGQVP